MANSEGESARTENEEAGKKGIFRHRVLGAQSEKEVKCIAWLNKNFHKAMQKSGDYNESPAKIKCLHLGNFP
jgi:hypothetical protein